MLIFDIIILDKQMSSKIGGKKNERKENLRISLQRNDENLV